MKISAVVCCVEYSDFLAHFLLWSKPAFERLIVVTSTTDYATHDLCEHHHVECVKTDAFYHDGQAFDKGAGINAGLERLDPEHWWCHIDADVMLPPRTKHLLAAAQLDPRMIYGCDRLMCQSYDAWSAYTSAPEIQHSCNAFVQANAFPMGTRVASMAPGQDGWVPIGFFQLWHPKWSGNRTYPSHANAGRGDMLFAQFWKRAQRALLAEIVAIHLESEPSPMAANWRGRKTPCFGPTPPRPAPRCPPPSEY